MAVIKGEKYKHKDGDIYVVNEITKIVLSNKQKVNQIDYSQVDNLDKVYIRTEEHFENSFTILNNNKES